MARVSKKQKARELAEEYKLEKKNQRKKRILVMIFFITMALAVFAIYEFRHLKDLGFEINVATVANNEIWDVQTTLNIFDNDLKGDKMPKTIKPGSNGVYRFVINNYSMMDVDYMITCNDQKDVPVELDYRLTKAEEYDSGSYDLTWKTVGQVYDDGTISKHDSQEYVLEWFWHDKENDTLVGFQSGYYILNIVVNTEANLELVGENNN